MAAASGGEEEEDGMELDCYKRGGRNSSLGWQRERERGGGGEGREVGGRQLSGRFV
jgi:hypothetical protein